MTAPLAHGGPDTCPSQLSLDRLFAGELHDLERARLLRHVAGCTPCAEALAERQAERDAFVPDAALEARLARLSAAAASEEANAATAAAMTAATTATASAAMTAATSAATTAAASSTGESATPTIPPSIPLSITPTTTPSIPLSITPSALAAPAGLAPRPPRPPLWKKLAPAVLALGSCAALLALTLRPGPAEPPIDRRATRKGGGPAVEPQAVQLFVQRGGELVPIADGGRLHPGDQLQLVLRVAAPRFVALYSKDGAGAVSRYAPIDSAMVEVRAGEEVVLPNSTVLDDVLGPERLAVFFCARPLEEAVLRAQVEAGQPAGCEVRRLRLDKVLP